MPRPVKNEKQLLELAQFYCSRRETSRLNLRRYLLGKIDPDSALIDALDAVLDKCERLKIIDHERYAEILTRESARRGKGRLYLEQIFEKKGLTDEFKKVEFSEEAEYERAVLLANKTFSLARIQHLEDTSLRKQKVMQKLVASGFEFPIAEKAIAHALKKE